MKKLFLILFSVFLISCSTDIPEEEKKGDININDDTLLYVAEPSLPRPVTGDYEEDYLAAGNSIAKLFNNFGGLREVIYCEGSGEYRITKKIDLNKCQSHEFEYTISDCKDVKKHRIIAEAGFGASNEGNIKEEVYQDRIYTCKYCSFRYRVHHNKNYQTEFFNDFLKKLESNCPARPKK